MSADAFMLPAADGVSLFVHRWLPVKPPKALVQIAHGLAEHGGRYARLAEQLNQAGYAVYANDHRGHGRTAANGADLGHLGDEKGWAMAVGDVGLLGRRMRQDYPGLPLILLGHSMGSFLTQQMLFQPGADLAGAVLCASNGAPPPIAWAGLQLARLERLRAGKRGRSWLLDQMSFADFNRRFKPNRTTADWLSRDPVEVDRYLADPYCGFRSTNETWVQLLQAIAAVANPTLQARIPKQLPIWVIAGAADAVSDNTRGLDQLLGAYQAAGLTRVDHRFYPGARHELFFETNRDEVAADLIAWMDGVVQ